MGQYENIVLSMQVSVRMFSLQVAGVLVPSLRQDGAEGPVTTCSCPLRVQPHTPNVKDIQDLLPIWAPENLLNSAKRNLWQRVTML